MDRDERIRRLEAELEALKASGDSDGPQAEPGAAGRRDSARSIDRAAIIWGGVVVAVLVGAIWAFARSGGATGLGQAGDSTGAGGDGGLPADLAEPATGWRYTEDTDPLTDQTVRTACVISAEAARLSSPYGDVPVQLCLRRSDRHGHDAFVALLGSGQIICRSYRSCTVRVRFDDGPVGAFPAGEASSGASNIIFIVDSTRLERGVQGAVQTRIELEFFRDGTQTFTFPTEGLEWPDRAAAARAGASGDAAESAAARPPAIAPVPSPSVTPVAAPVVESPPAAQEPLPAPPPRPAMITNPDWLQRPSGADLARYFPPRALERGVSGHVVLGCAVTESGALTACGVTDETPAGEGFGQASLRLTSHFRMRPQTRDGAPVGGARVNIPITWTAGEPPA